MPNSPELPESPRIYNTDEAIIFASAWSGLPSDLVERVLDAKFRYLELAGIVESGEEEDEALAQERQQFRHLLPETPDVVDERELDYVVQVTGLALDVVERVDQGDAAYQDYLGLSEWSDEEERGSRLGQPELAEEGHLGVEDDEPEDEAPMHEGHGDHWGCITSDVGTFIQEHLKQCPGPERLLFAVGAPDQRWEGVAAKSIPQAPGLETWRLDGALGSGEELITAYPVARDGTSQPLTLHKARVWEGGCEAIVVASTCFGASIAYFDTSFLHPWNEWGPDEEVTVQLAAFAYSLAPAADQIIQITKEETIRAIRASQELAPEEVTDLTPIEVHTRGMACFFPLHGGNPDEFEFQGPVTGVDVLHAWERTFYRLDVTVMRDTSGAEDVPFSVPIYVAEENLPDGYHPRAGDEVKGRLWLQGCPAGLLYPFVSEN
jgi:hypothetical protein